MTTTFRMAAAGLMLSAILAGCSQPADKPEAPAAPAVVATADTHPFRIGELQAVALRDGEIVLENAAGASPWDAAEVSELPGALAADGRIHLSVQPLLVRDGEHVVLIDTGAGGQMGTQNKLQGSLTAAGVQPGQVTDILISHAHGDHVGGLVANGALVFPNAAIRMSADEWTAMRADPEAAAVVPVIAPKVQTFASGAQVTPSITAIALNGHTPGHTGYEIVSGEDRLLYFGDALHSAVISVQRPEAVNAWDFNSDAAIATRQNLLERGATQSLRVYGVHFPWPGVGRFQKREETFVWAPDATR
ncbi:MBL fold metallo-hydrolase [Brevundimonas sp. NPDC092305]|uniref:MBL fold metallo-hydrolase n=1 Tax=Brevundimonas sp. NPDC092305 TaxID=3363957 RepID=UPI00382F900E